MGGPRVLRIFSRYQQFGGEERIVRQIHEALSRCMDATWFERSSDQLLGKSLAGMVTAPGKAIYNREVAVELTNLQEQRKFDAWEIHNVFPALSPSVYETGIRLGIPIVHYLHNYRLSCVNGTLLNHGQPCYRCLGGSFWPAVETKCWRSSRLACATLGIALTRVRQLKVFSAISSWIAISDAQKQWHIKMGIPSEQIHVVPHFLEPSTNLIAEKSPKRGYLLFLGRLSQEKGLTQLLKAWQLVKTSGAKLVIAGTGPEEASLRDYVARNRFDNIELRGFVPIEEQPQLWRGAAALIVPSIWEEPFGLVVLEAWAHYRPALVSNRGALPEIVRHPSLIFSPEDPVDVASKIDGVLDNPDARDELAIAGNRKLHRDYTLSSWRSRIATIYAGLGIRLKDTDSA
jgi:glycosyltransferase involved in cell wall biosynthesis